MFHWVHHKFWGSFSIFFFSCNGFLFRMRMVLLWINKVTAVSTHFPFQTLMDDWQLPPSALPSILLLLNLNLFHPSPIPVQEGIQANHTGRVTLPNETLMWVVHLSYQYFSDKNILLGSRKITNFQCLPLEWPLCQPVGWTDAGRPGRRMEKPLSFDECTSTLNPHHLWTSCEK